MSDEDSYEYEYNSDESDQPMDDASGCSDDNEEFEYTDDDDDQDQVDDVGVQLENAYYNAKGLRDDADFKEALEMFQSVIDLEKESFAAEGNGNDSDADNDDNADDNNNENHKVGSWTFKALKQIVKTRLRACLSNSDNNITTSSASEADWNEIGSAYKKLLACITNPNCEGVSPNAIEKGINGMLDRVSALFEGGGGSGSSKGGALLARNVYDSTLVLFHPKNGPCPNERLWFKTNLKYGQLLYENHETLKLQLVIRDLLHTSEQNNDPTNTANNNNDNNNNTNTTTSSTHLMEIYALQIQLHSRLKDNKKLREIFSKAMAVRGGIPHPRTLALIQELGGKMHMASREYEAANTAFFQAFKSYDEAGDIARLRCLKYLVLASMLHASSINPFDSQEVRPYKTDPEITAMTKMVDAFHNNDIQTFEQILSRNEGKVMDDEFIREYLADLLRTIRMQVLEKFIKPYSRVSLRALSKGLNGIPIEEVESLLVSLVLDEKLDGRIDQVNGAFLKNDNDAGRSGQGESGSDAMVESTSGGINSATNLDTMKAMPPWGATAISVQKFSAMEELMIQMETLTMAVAHSAGTKGASNHQFHSHSKAA